MTNAWDAPSTPYWGQSQYSPPSPPATKRKTEPAAIAAATLACVSLVIWIVPAIVAIFLAAGAKRNIKASGGTKRGKELALTAQIVAPIVLVIEAGVLALLALI